MEVTLKAWDEAGGVYRKLICNAEGKLIIDPTEIFEDTPTDNELGKAPTSNWAFDHDADAGAHHTKFTTVEHDTADRHALANLDPLVCSEAEADGKILTHKGDAAAHHAKFTTVEHDTADRHALANLDPLVCSEAEADSKITAHAADASAHHAKYTDAEAVASFGNRTATLTVGTYINYDVSNKNMLIFDTDGGDIHLKGLDNGVTGQIIFCTRLWRVTGNLIIYDASADAASDDRLLTTPRTNITIPAYYTSSFFLIYQGSAWICSVIT